MKIDIILGWLKRLQAQSQPSIAVKASGSTTITADQAKAGFYVSNLGAGAAVTFVLPAAKVGMHGAAVVQANQELRLDPSGTETIALPTGVQQAAGLYITANAIGETIEIVCLTAGKWDVVHSVGTWTVQP